MSLEDTLGTDNFVNAYKLLQEEVILVKIIF